MTNGLRAVLLTNNEIAQLQKLISGAEPGLAQVPHALAHPIENLAAFRGDFSELISRARDASAYIDEDFPELLKTLAALGPAYSAALAPRK